MIDRAEIVVRSGDGGRGVVSFRHEKFVPFGGPDGGDGGDGGNIVIVADGAVTSLKAFRRRRYYKAARGRDGAGQKKHGKKGEDLVLVVPVGTVVSAPAGDGLLADLSQPGQSVVPAKGGRGGKGNARFATPTNQAPQIAQPGEGGEELAITLELKLIADVGLIGYPNAGKSTLLAAVSKAKPKIAGYPFTTREPVLGVVEVSIRSFVLAEIPGLIKDAHLGKGLGHDFLRHIERTRLLIHLVDGSSESPVEDMAQVNTELSLFDPALAKKPQLVAVNKVDLPQVEARRAEIAESFAAVGTDVFFVSAARGQGLTELMTEAWKRLQSIPEAGGIKVPEKVFRPRPRAYRRQP